MDRDEENNKMWFGCELDTKWESASESLLSSTQDGAAVAQPVTVVVMEDRYEEAVCTRAQQFEK